ncbi:50S ribosomal protein L6 [Patescibacteria group bacterium]|nr:50S ribosomal protein L6 [Patescibacteria group bacterium]MBU1663113.1 50S ribosomal protein L6 [Patescibacteria group bacterium]MBU1933700.1 50S ribosomal protein L6 [Patescibacteria group bacterium]MBU2008012.1 50S ribosomal protein L6 [Patescibacteria group bacterium]MBU2233697.1 50S ribosomal protein L6 [Patescibacteria group bacterium]
MSRLGKLPIELPAGTRAWLDNGFMIVKGPKGELKTKMHEIIKTAITDKEIILSIDDQTIGKNKALWGLFRSLIKNMVIGVNETYTKKLEINGVGYKAAVSGDKLTLNVGYSHPVIYNLPVGIKVEVQANIIIINGIDKQLVGEVSAQIRKIRKPEPYKGKGIKYDYEILRRKAGKTAGKTEK